MSIFYNVKITGDRDEKEQASFDQLGGSGAILNNQSEYQVGVVRFKIPITDVPLYRVYENEFYLSQSLNGFMSWTRNSDTKNLNFSDYCGNQALIDRYTLFDGTNVNTNVGNYGIDVDYNNKKYVDIYSQEQFVDLMNNALTRSFTGAVYNSFFTTPLMTFGGLDPSVEIATHDIVSGTSYQAQAINVSENNLQIDLATWTAVSDDKQTPAGSYTTFTKGGLEPGYVIVGCELNLGNILDLSSDPSYVAGTQDANKFDFGAWEWSLQKLNGSGEVEESYIFCSGILRGQGAFQSTSTPNTKGKAIKIGTTPQCFLKAQSQTDNKMYIANQGNTQEFSLFPQQSNFNGLLGSEYLTCKDGSAASYKLVATNLTGPLSNNVGTISDPLSSTIEYTNGFYAPVLTGNDMANNVKIYLAPKQLFHYGFPNFGAYEANPDGTATEPATTMNTNRIPQFIYDTPSQKISLIGNNQWMNTNNFKLYMNERLDSLISFSSYRCGNIDSGNYSKYLMMSFDDSGNPRPFIDKYKGYIYNFPAELGRTLEDGSTLEAQVVSARGTSTTQNYLNTAIKWEETFSSAFCRDWLNGILIATGSIAVDGEIIGSDDAKRKVLTDFIIDPAQTARDYVVYNNDGGTRYYKMGTTQDLRQVDLQVFFEDIWGRLRRLNILPSQECSIKLEFKPNNMIYNYLDTSPAINYN